LHFFFIFPFYTNAQHPQFQAVSNEIKNRYEDRQKRIKAELASLQENEWAGEYSAYWSSINGALFIWAPSNGFTVRSGNDLHRTVEQVNYGSVSFNGKLLTLSPEYLENNKHNYPVPTSFMPIKWGKQHWLIPSDELIRFIYAVNSGDENQIYSFLVKEGDSQKTNNGLPIVPKEYRKYFKQKPITAKVIDLKENDNVYLDYTFTLNAGKAEGVIEGMMFYLIKVKDIRFWLRVTDVEKHSSKAEITSISYSVDYEKIKPKVGWKFSSKFPKDY
jgi:hypothetical protein